MKVFVAGAGGAIGAALLPLLLARGDEVVATTRSEAKSAALAAQGVEPVVLDLLDRPAVIDAILATEPDAVIHQATALTGTFDVKHFDRFFTQTNLLRTTGTDNLLAGAERAGVDRLVAQSFAGFTNTRAGGALAVETDPLDDEQTSSAPQSLAAVRHLEQVVPAAGGLVLRYGFFYGPRTSLGAHGEITELVRARKLPVVGGGSGVWSFAHIADAAAATVAALDRGAAGVYNVVDDEPAAVAEWLPGIAAAIGAKPPMRLPSWLARPMVGRRGIDVMTKLRGSSNARAKRELGWQPRYASWRDGFRAGLDH